MSVLRLNHEHLFWKSMGGVELLHPVTLSAESRSDQLTQSIPLLFVGERGTFPELIFIRILYSYLKKKTSDMDVAPDWEWTFLTVKSTD